MYVAFFTISLDINSFFPSFPFFFLNTIINGNILERLIKTLIKIVIKSIINWSIKSVIRRWWHMCDSNKRNCMWKEKTREIVIFVRWEGENMSLWKKNVYTRLLYIEKTTWYWIYKLLRDLVLNIHKTISVEDSWHKITTLSRLVTQDYKTLWNKTKRLRDTRLQLFHFVCSTPWLWLTWK